MTNREYKYRAKLVAEAGIKKQERLKIERCHIGWEGRYWMYKIDEFVELLLNYAREELV